MTAKLTLGPIIFHWDAAVKRDFYARIADESAIDTVYLGEVICSKRTPYFDKHIPDVIERLERGGKRVVLSSLCEVVLPRERRMISELCESESHAIEVNNVAGLIDAAGHPHRIGPLMNVYNEETLRILASDGATHFTLPTELPRDVVAHLASAAAAIGVAVEVQIFGRASLAVSARCYHARAHGRTKDNCQFVCESDPDGMVLKTIDGRDFLAINGIQTLSHSYVNLCGEIDDLIAMGVGHLRLMPNSADMIAIAAIFADHIAGRVDVPETRARLDDLAIPAPFSNGFWHGVAGHQLHLG